MPKAKMKRTNLTELTQKKNLSMNPKWVVKIHPVSSPTLEQRLRSTPLRDLSQRCLLSFLRRTGGRFQVNLCAWKPKEVPSKWARGSESWETKQSEGCLHKWSQKFRLCLRGAPPHVLPGTSRLERVGRTQTVRLDRQFVLEFRATSQIPLSEEFRNRSSVDKVSTSRNLYFTCHQVSWRIQYRPVT